MLQRWTDLDGNEHRVLDDYNRNVTLRDPSVHLATLDLLINDVVEDAMEPKKVSSRVTFMKFFVQNTICKE